MTKENKALINAKIAEVITASFPTHQSIIDFFDDSEGKYVGDWSPKDVYGNKVSKEDLDAPLWTEAGLYGRVGKDLARELLGRRQEILDEIRAEKQKMISTLIQALEKIEWGDIIK